VNLLAGILVGILYHGMTAGEAAKHFAILSIGDAMVSAIPSLLICVAAGVLITRVADDTRTESRSLGQEILEQMTASTRAIYIAAVLVLAFAAIPGFPSTLFVLLSLGLASAGRFLSKRNSAASQAGVPMRALQSEGAKGAVPTILRGPPSFAQPLAMRVSPGLAAAFDYTRFDSALTAQRLALQSRLGVPFPGVTMWVCHELPDSCFEVLINDVPIRRVVAPAGHLWLSEADSVLAAHAQKQGPLMHQDQSLWVADGAISADQRSLCFAVEDAAAKQIVACLSQSAHMFVGIQEVQGVIDRVALNYPGLAAEVQKILPLPRIAEVLRRLLEEQVPVRARKTC
jgi:type III secretion protein V